MTQDFLCRICNRPVTLAEGENMQTPLYHFACIEPEKQSPLVRSLDDLIAELPPDRRAKVEARTRMMIELELERIRWAESSKQPQRNEP
jgi:hypothetical protein